MFSRVQAVTSCHLPHQTQAPRRPSGSIVDTARYTKTTHPAPAKATATKPHRAPLLRQFPDRTESPKTTQCNACRVSKHVSTALRNASAQHQHTIHNRQRPTSTSTARPRHNQDHGESPVDSIRVHATKKILRTMTWCFHDCLHPGQRQSATRPSNPSVGSNL